MIDGTHGPIEANTGDDVMAADVTCGAGAGFITIQTLTVPVERQTFVEVHAECNGQFAAAGAAIAEFALFIDGVRQDALVAPDTAIGVQRSAFYQIVAPATVDQVIPFTMKRLFSLARGERVITLRCSATTLDFEVNGLTDAQHGSALLAMLRGIAGATP